jgi:putative phosphoesterase
LKTLYIASDIHGSYAYLKKFLQIVDLDKEDKHVIFLGDTYNHGPRNPFPEEYAPMKVEALLEERMGQFDLIKGNCDSEVDQMISPFKIRRDFCLKDGSRHLYFTHGHKVNKDLPKKNAKAGDVVFYGHFHTPYHTVIDGVNYVCVGSVAMPKDNTPHTYVIYRNNTIVIKSLDGNTISQIKL